MKKIFSLFVIALFSASMFADTWTVAGDNTTILGTSYDPSNTDNDMSQIGESDYWKLLVNNFSALDAEGSVQYKVCLNNGWGTAYPSNNQWCYLPSGTSSVLFTFNADTHSTFAFSHVTVSGGSEALFGYSWGIHNENDMIYNNDVYTFTKDGVALTAGSIEYRIVANHDEAWRAAWPGSNATLSIAEDGKYDVTITFNPYTFEVSANAQKKEDVVVLPTIKLCRKWDLEQEQEYSEIELTPAQDSLTASITQTFAAADLGQYEFAMKKDGGWASNGSGTTFDRDHTSAEITGNDGYMKIFVDVTTAITFTWTYATNTLTITYPSLPAKPVIAAKGYWDKFGAASVFTDNGANASWSRHLSKGTYTFYILHNGSKRCLDGNNNTRYEFHRNWNSDAITGCGTQTEMIINTDIPGDYTLRWTYESNLLTIVYPDSLEIEFHLNFKWGEENWELKKLSASEDSWFTTSLNINPAGTYEYQIRKYDPNHNTPQTVWYGAQNYGATMTSDNCTNWQLTTDNDYHVNLNANKTGDYTFEFNAATAKMNVVYPSATALDNTDASTKAVKRIVNGQLVIEREGKLFNALGAEVK